MAGRPPLKPVLSVATLTRLNGRSSRRCASTQQEPGAPLGLVDPDLDQAGAGNVAMLVAQVVGLAQAGRQRLVVVTHLGQHVGGFHVLGVVVQHTLGACDVADRAQRAAADLADAFGQRVGHREQLLGLFVEHQVIVAKVRAAHVPVEVLGFQVEREHIGQHAVQGGGDVLRGRWLQVGGRGQWRVSAGFECAGRGIGLGHLSAAGRKHRRRAPRGLRRLPGGMVNAGSLGVCALADTGAFGHRRDVN